MGSIITKLTAVLKKLAVELKTKTPFAGGVKSTEGDCRWSYQCM